MRSSVAVIITLCCLFYIVQARPSWYYSNKASDGYHPPYDFSTQDSQANCGPVCPTNYQAFANSSYVVTYSDTCTNMPTFMDSSQAFLSGLSFDSCCGIYEQCAQQCGNTKDYCDQQLYGCMWSQCGYSYRVRPGDRMTCRAWATCYASYLVSNMTCDIFTSMQQQACICSPVGTAPLTTDPTNANTTAKRQVNSTDSGSTMSGSMSSSSTTNNNNNNAPISYVTYKSRMVPLFSNIAAQCPPYVGSYINVMSDQEMDDISYYSTNSGSGLSVWLRFLF